jgi:hypothetical protein
MTSAAIIHGRFCKVKQKKLEFWREKERNEDAGQVLFRRGQAYAESAYTDGEVVSK